MLEALTSLGIDYKLLIAQLVNFVLLFIVLYIFLYKPVLKMLNERSKKVDKSLDDADRIEKRLVEVEKEIDNKLKEADKKSTALINEAKQQGKSIESGMTVEAQKKADQIVEKAKVEILNQQQKMLSEAQLGIANLVSETIRLIAQDKTLKLDSKMIDGTISKLKTDVKNG